MDDFRELSQEIGSAPLGDLIAAIGRGVGEAQAALDAGALEQTLALYDQSDDLQQALRELGYRPTFYTIPEAEGELKLSLTLTSQPAKRPTTKTPRTRQSRQPSIFTPPTGLPQIYAAPVDSAYQNSYSYSSQVSATVKFKVVAVPPPNEADNARVVPSLIGMQYQAAQELAADLDLATRVVNGDTPAVDAVITGQEPAVGELVTVGDAVTLEF